MKKVLIICDLFPPAFAPRMGYLCKYIHKFGWQPEVVTEFINENTYAFLEKECPITYVKFYSESNRILRKIQWFVLFILDFIFGYKDYLMYKKADKICKKGHFDLILCSTFRTFPLPAALKVARKNKLPLVVDLRDIIEQYTGNEYISHSLKTIPIIDEIIISLFKKKLIKRRNRVLNNACYITTVSPWHVQQLRHYNPKVSLIYNGYDPELFYPNHHPTEKFQIIYTGRILSLAMRNPKLLYTGLKLSGLSPNEISVEWYVDTYSKELLEKAARKYQVAEYMNYHNFIPASDLPQLLNNGSILLIVAEKFSPTGPKGIMTTKLFESLAIKKPILCIPSDESYLEQIINNSKSGLAAKTSKEVADFICYYYKQWKADGYTYTEPDRKEIQRFSREVQAGQFAKLFNSITSNQ